MNEALEVTKQALQACKALKKDLQDALAAADKSQSHLEAALGVEEKPAKKRKRRTKAEMMASALTTVAVLIIMALFFAPKAHAQTVTYIWNGSTDSSAEIGLYSVDGVQTFSSGGWGGAIQIVNGTTLALLSLPQPGTCSTDGLFESNCTGIVAPFLPNQSFLDCWSNITWGDKQWGTRADGTTMDGTQSGDFYNVPGSVGVCTLWNGSASITLSLFHQFELRKVCVAHAYRWCTKYAYELQDIYVGGSGTAVGTPAPAEVASLYLCGSNRHACLR